MDNAQEAPKKRGRPANPRPMLIDGPRPPEAPTAAIGDITEVWKNGRPYKYSNLSEMQQLIDTYFLECDATNTRPNVSGLALALHTSYKQLCQWEALRPGEDDPEWLKVFKIGISKMVAHAKTRASLAWWANLEDRDKARGAEFALKVMGYQDKPEYQGPQAVTVNQQNTLIIGNSPEIAGLLAGILPASLASDTEDT